MAAQFRKLQTSFWRDTANDDLTKDEQHLYCYLLTNQSTNLCGIFKIKLKTIMFESLLTEKEFAKAVEGLQNKGKIVYDRDTDEFLSTRWNTVYDNTSPTVQKSIMDSLSRVKSERLKAIRETIVAGTEYVPDKPAPDEPEEKKPPAREYVSIIGHLAEVTGKGYRPDTASYQRLIRTCRNQNKDLTIQDFINVIDEKARQWLNKPEMAHNLRPETLFGPKFPTYLAEATRNGSPTVPKKEAPRCPVCNTLHTLTNSTSCAKCAFDMTAKDNLKLVEAYKKEMIDAGFGERLGIA